jgi:hypothetical protein
VCDLLNYHQGVRHATGLESVPEAVDLDLEFGCQHTLKLSDDTDASLAFPQPRRSFGLGCDDPLWGTRRGLAFDRMSAASGKVTET